MNIPTEKLTDKTYMKILEEMERLRSNQLKHKFEINKLGTNNLFYSIIDSLSSPFQKNKKYYT